MSYCRLLFFLAAPYKQHLCTSDFYSVNRSKTVVGAFHCCHELRRLSTLHSNCPSRSAVLRHMKRILVMIRLLLDSIVLFIIAHLDRQVDRKIPDVPRIRFFDEVPASTSHTAEWPRCTMPSPRLPVPPPEYPRSVSSQWSLLLVITSREHS